MVDMAAIPSTPARASAGRRLRAWRFVRRNPTMVVGLAVLGAMLLAALAAPWIAGDPHSMKPVQRFKPPSDTVWFGTDNLGRDVYARTIYGARVSLAVGLTVAVVAVSIGLLIGLLAGFFRPVEAIVMRLMDGLMAIPAILLAIALVSLMGSSVRVVIIAITIPEIPRVVRLVRSVVLTIREEPYVEAAISVGTPLHKILWRHVLPNTVAPVIVQGTFICASAVLAEAALSFLGIGIPTDTPTWGNIMAEGRQFFRVYPHNIFFPAIFLTITVLAVNMLGDGLRDTLDPKMSKRV